jgi:hypothetical protein
MDIEVKRNERAAFKYEGSKVQVTSTSTTIFDYEVKLREKKHLPFYKELLAYMESKEDDMQTTMKANHWLCQVVDELVGFQDLQNLLSSRLINLALASILPEKILAHKATIDAMVAAMADYKSMPVPPDPLLPSLPPDDRKAKMFAVVNVVAKNTGYGELFASHLKAGIHYLEHLEGDDDDAQEPPVVDDREEPEEENQPGPTKRRRTEA